MARLILCGCNGYMGRAFTAACADRCDCEIVAGIDRNTENHAGFPVYANPANCAVSADVLVDFSHPSALSGVLSYCLLHHLPAVIATTGLSEEQVLAIHKAAETVPIFFSANMSLGVALMAELAQKAAAVLGDSFDVEIIEQHHHQKVDAPSGTAYMLAKAVSDGLSYTPQYVYDRHDRREKRDRHEIGFHSIRGGTIVGEHEVLFAGQDEQLRLSHRAESKGVFAVGALNAAQFLLHQPAGLYTMRDLINAAE